MDYPSSRYQHDRKRMEMEAEMSRFEQEISTPSGHGQHGQHGQHGYQLESLPSSYEPLPRNSQLFIPHQIQRQIPTTQYKSSSSYNSVPPPTVNYTVTPMGLPPNVAAPVTSSGSQGTTGGGSSSGQKKHKSGAQIRKHKKSLRMAGGTVWEDNSLVDWDPNDFRLFCGDLGNDVTDEVLNRAFNKYPSFLKSKVIRDKRTNKTKGYGFVSFKDPQDFIRAMREMNGKYVGSRPIKLRKSTWRDRNMEVVKKKNKEKAKLGLL